MNVGTGVYDLEKDPDDCIGFLPKPGCGKAPEQAGDRGGALQYSVFALMLGGLGIIGTVVICNAGKPRQQSKGDTADENVENTHGATVEGSGLVI